MFQARLFQALAYDKHIEISLNQDFLLKFTSTIFHDIALILTMKTKQSVLSLSFIITILFSPLLLFAKRDVPRVCIGYMIYPSTMPDSTAQQLKNYITQGFNDTLRVRVTEIPISDSELLIPDSIIDKIDTHDLYSLIRDSVKADYTVECLLREFTVEKRHANGRDHFFTRAILNLKIQDVSTGRILSVRDFWLHPKSLGEPIDDYDESVKHILKDVPKVITGFVQQDFPLLACLLEPIVIEKGKVISAYIDLGTAHKVRAKDKYDICIIRHIAGRKIFKTIGTARVTSVNSEDRSTIEIINGQQELKEAIDSGQTIRLRWTRRRIMI